MHPAASVRLYLAAASLLAPSLALPAQNAASILKQVDTHYDHLRTLRARYTEHYTGMGMDRSESGTLQLARPGRMRWDYDIPTGKLFLLDGKFAWSYTPGDTQVQRLPAKKLDDVRSPLRFLLGQTHLARELTNLSVVPTASGYHIAGVPRGMEGRVRRLSVEVDLAGTIHRLRFEELDGSATDFLFTEVLENLPIAAKVFTFAAPPGVSVVQGLPPI